MVLHKGVGAQAVRAESEARAPDAHMHEAAPYRGQPVCASQREKGEMLRTMAVPEVARRYYEEDNPFLFDLLCTMSGCVSEPASVTVM